jgi:hypothetical protein
MYPSPVTLKVCPFSVNGLAELENVSVEAEASNTATKKLTNNIMRSILITPSLVDENR